MRPEMGADAHGHDSAFFCLASDPSPATAEPAAERNGLHPPSINAAYLPAFVSLYEFGLSIQQVATVFGVSRWRVYALFKRHNVPRRDESKRRAVREGDPRRRLSDSEILLVRRLARGGVAQNMLAKLFDMSKPGISRVVHHHHYAEMWESSHVAA